VTFGEIEAGATRRATVAVANEGSAPLAVETTRIGGRDAGAFAVADGGGSFVLEAGASRELTVAFAPTAAGDRRARLAVETDDPDDPVVRASLAGSAVVPAPASVAGGTPTDPDGNGLYEDVNGDGRFDVVDVQALFGNRDAASARSTSGGFDFNRDGAVTIVDVQKLFRLLY
jgi:PKD repeat protein